MTVLLIFLPTSLKATSDPQLEWPITFTKPWNKLSSTFGPRLQASENYRYDFHRGIDIPGDRADKVVAAADGTVFRVYSDNDPASPYYSSGTTIIVRHHFEQPWYFHGQAQTTYYSLYMHLASVATNLTEGQSVQAGDTLGYIGKSGDTNFSHLHFEIRVGTTCSLEAACNTTGFDPHINPLTFLTYPQNNHLGLQVSSQATALQLRLKISRRELDVNRVIVTSYNHSAQPMQTKTLNFNTRHGLAAQSTTTLDQANYNGLTLQPQKFSARSKNEILNLTYNDFLTDAVGHAHIKIYDVHGNLIAHKRYQR
ncbi:MAG: hypothetical protein ACD_43C00220G0001 [uncultured bacterium]|nr:MAG: hypothetical protein ACD_43C00220G0001 [uncultured bacterium]